MNPVTIPDGFGQTRGSEHEVWFSENGRAIKATHSGECGRAFGPARFATQEEYLERIRLTVEIFGLDWQVHGIHGGLAPIDVIVCRPSDSLLLAAEITR